MTDAELVLLPLGGVGEIGMNLALYGYGPPDDRTWLAVDFGDVAPLRIEIWIEQHFGPPGGDVDRIGEQ